MLNIEGLLIDSEPVPTPSGIGAHRDNGGRLVVESKKPRPRYGLDELLARCDATADPTVEDQEWLNAKPVGTELL